MAWFRRKAPPPSPLWHFIADHTPERVGTFLDKATETAESSTKYLQDVIFRTTLMCTAQFLQNVGASVRKEFVAANPDVIAFEALAYCMYAIKETHLPTPDDPFDESDDEVLVDAYRETIYLLELVIKKLTGWDIEKIWDRRILGHFQQKNMKEASQALVGTLLTIGEAKVPTVDYGPMKLDLPLQLQLMVGVPAFTISYPPGAVCAIKAAISEYSLLD